jgi:hypothetical protein
MNWLSFLTESSLVFVFRFSPYLLFVSQSLFPGDGSMLVHFGHEFSHFWFGLLLGARDWTEEWLSEGFATFIEDAIHAQTMGVSTASYFQFILTLHYPVSTSVLFWVK